MRLIGLHICLFLLLPALSMAQNDPIFFTRKMAVDEARAAAQYLSAREVSGSSNASDNFDVHHYRCDFLTDPAIRYISGVVTVSFTMTRSSGLVALDLVDSLRVDSVIYHGHPTGFSRPLNHTVVVSFPAALAKGESDSFTVHYQGVPPSGTGFGSYAVTTHSGVPVMWTLSEPYGSREWWPCKNGLDDKADSIDVSITTPESYLSTSNGMPVGEFVANGSRTTWWKHRYPIATYLVAISSTNFIVQSDTVSLGNTVMPVVQYVWPESTDMFASAFTMLKYGLHTFSGFFGDYPFIRERYGQTQFGWGGGMEHQTNTFLSTITQNLVYHEMGHQWFGDKITCGSWQHIWLNEGFATFCQYILYEKLYPYAQNQAYRKSLVKAVTAQPNGSVFVADTTDVGRIFNGRLSYNKGAMLLRMLRGKLGDDAFFRGIREYLEDSALAYRYAVTADLQQHLEKTGGVSLTEFFKDWFYGEGYPSYLLHWKPVGTDWVNLNLGQTTSDPSVNFYEMPVPVKFIKGNLEKTVVINQVRNHQQEYINLGFTPDSVVIDPEYWLVSWNNSVVRDADDLAGDPEMKAYPNPVVDQLHVLLQRMPAGHTSIRLHNTTGQLVWKEERELVRSNDYLLIPMERMARGLYWLSVSQGGKPVLVKKLLK